MACAYHRSKSGFSNVSTDQKDRFLLAHLYFESLKAAKSPKAVRMALEKLGAKAVRQEETGLASSAYDHAYTIAMDRIRGQALGQRELALDALMWLAFALRPMTMTELQEALAVEVGEPAFDATNMSDAEDIISACIGLAIVDEGSSVVRLVHHTAREFFQRNLHKWVTGAESQITAICTTCLSFDIHVEKSSRPESPDAKVNNGSVKNLHALLGTDSSHDKNNLEHGKAFYSYALRYWGEHASNLETTHPGVLDFLRRPDHVEDAGFQLSARQGMTSIQLAAHFGLRNVVEALLEEGWWELSSQDFSGVTALMDAAWGGHESTVDLILDRGADVNCADYSGRTALHCAAVRGRPGIVRKLLSRGANVDATDRSLQTALLLASVGVHEECISILVEHNANVDLAAKKGFTPLLNAVYTRNVPQAMSLIAAGADVSVRVPDKSKIKIRLQSGQSLKVAGQSPLSFVSGWLNHIPGEKVNFDSLIQLLVDGGANVNDQDAQGRSPLYFAVEEANDATVRKLLDFGADPNLCDHEGESAWSLALKDRATEWCPAGVSILEDIMQMLKKAGGGKQDDLDPRNLPVRNKNKRNANDELVSENSKRSLSFHDI